LYFLNTSLEISLLNSYFLLKQQNILLTKV